MGLEALIGSFGTKLLGSRADKLNEMLGNSTSPSGQTTVTTTSEPWKGVQPYLTGENGIYGQAQNLYNQGQWSPQMQQLMQQQMETLQGRSHDAGMLKYGANEFLSGLYDPKISPIPYTQGANQIN